MADLDDLTRDLRKARSKARRLAQTPLRESAKEIRRQVYDELRGTPYRSRRLRNMGGAPLKVSYRIRGNTAHVEAGLPGPWAIVERGARPHRIPNSGRIHRRLAFGGQVVWGPVHHPGVRGYQPWEHGVDKAEPKIAALWAKTLDAFRLGD